MWMVSASDGLTFTAKQAALRVGLGYHLVDNWARGRTPLVRPTVPSKGKGTRRSYSFRDLVALRLAQELREAGAKAEAIRRGFCSEATPCSW